MNSSGPVTSLVPRPFCYAHAREGKEGCGKNYYQELMSRPKVATLPLYGHILKWGVSVVFIANAPRYKPRVRVIPRAYGAVDDGKRVTRVSQFTAMEQERERKIERLGKR